MDVHKKPILFQALADAQEGSQEALAWLQGDEVGFRFWCLTYGIDPARACHCLKKALKAVGASRKQRRKLILKTLKEHPELSNREIAGG